ncbi:MAG TPA: type II toxin-antitoxin system PemK/MazF family toxin [Candidatus Paceibacterota bacterium]
MTVYPRKDFDEWNARKKSLHESEKEVLFHEREIWWCSLGVNVGYEQDGAHNLFERPVLVIKKFNHHVLWVVPLTRTNKENPYYTPVTVGDLNSSVILSQLRLISANRLQRYMRKLPHEQFKKVVDAIQGLFPHV